MLVLSLHCRGLLDRFLGAGFYRTTRGPRADWSPSPLSPVVVNQVNRCPRGHLATPGNIFGCHSGWRGATVWMPPNAPRCTGQPHSGGVFTPMSTVEKCCQVKFSRSSGRGGRGRATRLRSPAASEAGAAGRGTRPVITGTWGRGGGAPRTVSGPAMQKLSSGASLPGFKPHLCPA